MNRKKWIILSLLFLWILTGLLATFNNYDLALFGYSDVHTYYISGRAKVLGSVWIHPVMQSKRRVFSAAPLFSFTRIGQPYSAGIMVADYDNKEQYVMLELVSLIVTRDGLSKQIVDAGSVVKSEFEDVYAECTYSLEDRIDETNDKPIYINAEFLLHKSGSFVRETIEAKVSPLHYSGFWTIWDILSV